MKYYSILVAMLVLIPQVSASVCSVYFTGIGCPHCAKSDPVVLVQSLERNPELVVIEYEIYQQQENARLLYDYEQVYNSGLGVPLLVFSKNISIIGDMPIISQIDSVVSGLKSNPCPLLGNSIDFESLDLASLPGKPKIWSKNRVLVKQGDVKIDGSLLRNLLLADIQKAVASLKDAGIRIEKVDVQPMPLSGSFVNFDHAILIEDSWLFEWRGQDIDFADKTEGEIEHVETACPVWLVIVLVCIILLIIIFDLMRRRKRRWTA